MEAVGRQTTFGRGHREVDARQCLAGAAGQDGTGGGIRRQMTQEAEETTV